MQVSRKGFALYCHLRYLIIIDNNNKQQQATYKRQIIWKDRSCHSWLMCRIDFFRGGSKMTFGQTIVFWYLAYSPKKGKRLMLSKNLICLLECLKSILYNGMQEWMSTEYYSSIYNTWLSIIRKKYLIENWLEITNLKII